MVGRNIDDLKAWVTLQSQREKMSQTYYLKTVPYRPHTETLIHKYKNRLASEIKTRML